MKHKGSPGDVAMVMRRDGSEDRAYWNTTHGMWATQYGYTCQWQTVRPLAVIDPENDEQVERLVALLLRSGAVVANMHESVKQALREFADPKPPKPEEPTYFGAVAVDSADIKWVHVGSGLWCKRNTYLGEPWDQLDIVRVLHEGAPDEE